MQNKHHFFPFLGIPTYGEGAVKPVGPNSQLLPKICFGGFPDCDYYCAMHLCCIILYDNDNFNDDTLTDQDGGGQGWSGAGLQRGEVVHQPTLGHQHGGSGESKKNSE